VGFHGRDVDMIIRDLVEASLLLTKKQKRARMMPDVVRRVEDRILDSLTGKQSRVETRETFLRFLRNGSLEQREIEIEIPAPQGNPGAGGVVGFDPAQQGGYICFGISIVL
jgi:ATP-dependent HslUV protease ATP-binding subunit HslU